MRDSQLRDALACLPATVQRKWYTDEVLEDLAKLWNHIQNHKGYLKRISLAASRNSSSRLSRDSPLGYVCDNTTPLSSHSGNVLTEFCAILDRLILAYWERDRDYSLRKNSVSSIPKAQIFCGSASERVAAIAPESVDLLLTSPPYFGVTDYVKSQRLSMEWSGYEIEPLRLKEIGARSKRHRGDAAESDIAELQNAFRSMVRCMKPDGTCVLIIGESLRRRSVLMRQ